jgi:hypothetical protein
MIPLVWESNKTTAVLASVLIVESMGAMSRSLASLLLMKTCLGRRVIFRTSAWLYVFAIVSEGRISKCAAKQARTLTNNSGFIGAAAGND